jgi:hypothetical protein
MVVQQARHQRGRRGGRRSSARTSPAPARGCFLNSGTGAPKCALADRFPYGQLVVDLLGMDDHPPGPTELMLRVLKALGVADRDLTQAGPEGRPELHRQVLAERRFLLVLDNARDEAQVRPLLPSAGTSMAVITSRRMLTGLESVHRLPVSELSPADAAAFPASVVGQGRTDADPAALAEVAHRCGHLPLALRVAGNWLATRSGWTVRRLADRLALEECRLDTLTAGASVCRRPSARLTASSPPPPPASSGSSPWSTALTPAPPARPS